VQPAREVEPDLLGTLLDAAGTRRGVIVAGGGIEDPAGVHALSAALGWPVLADPRSGCRRPESATISHFDAILRVPESAAGLAPEVVLRLGSLPASKVLGQWLAALDAWQVAVEHDGTRYDPDRTLDGIVAAPPGATAGRLAAMAPPTPADAGEWRGRWAHADALAAEAIASVLAGHAEPTEPATARDVVRALPTGAALVVSSSMPVRDVEWYSAPHPDVTVHANRGANGIDGVVSTAVGVALARMASPGVGPTVALLGDLAFVHDTNGLLGLVSRGVDLTFVVVDNDGGGIFSFLPQAGALEPARFEQLFGTPHGVDLVALAGAHGVSARRVARQREVGPAVAESIALGGVHVVVVPTDRAANVVVHDEIHAAVAAALS
jgi:2-succinyl-5-enolpyruvyl-6-hydroxy-3-cyclohexene-1-carboxylate synthase